LYKNNKNKFKKKKNINKFTLILKYFTEDSRKYRFGFLAHQKGPYFMEIEVKISP
jgi:hypothetical protein